MIQTVLIIAINPFDYYSPTVVQENPLQCRKLIFSHVAEQDSFSRSLVALGKIEVVRLAPRDIAQINPSFQISILATSSKTIRAAALYSSRFSSTRRRILVLALYRLGLLL